MTERKGRIKSAAKNFSQSAKSVGKVASKGVRTAGDVAAQSVKSAGDAAAERAKAAGESAMQGMRATGDVATRATESARSAAGQGARTVGDGTGAIGQRISWESVLPDPARRTLVASIESSRELSAGAKRNLVAQIGPALDRLPANGMSAQVQTLSVIQALLASDQISRAVNEWIQSLVEGLDTINMDAMVAGYTETVATEVYFPESADYAEMMDTTYIETVASESFTLVNLEISSSWLNDLASYDVVELVAGSIGILAVALNWNNDDVEEFSSIVGSIGLSAVVSANPLMLIVTIAALAKAFHSARKSGDWKEFSDGLAKGGICTGAVLLTTSLVSGPSVVVLLTGICVGILAHQATKRVSFVEIGQFMVHEIRKAPPLLESAVASARDVLPNST